jgi:hypothetical protein
MRETAGLEFRGEHFADDRAGRSLLTPFNVSVQQIRSASSDNEYRPIVLVPDLTGQPQFPGLILRGSAVKYSLHFTGYKY